MKYTILASDKIKMIGYNLNEVMNHTINFIKYDSIRVFNENSAITLEYNPGRLNLVVNNFDVVTEVYYG